MDESEREPPHAGERLTRDDALRLREEHGGPEGLDLRQADLRQANLAVLDLHGARLDGANLQGANLHQVNLQGAAAYGANLEEAVLSEAKLGGAILWAAKLRQANLQGADLQDAGLVNADLHRAYLVGANLQGANLHQANLQRAELWAAKLQGAQLVGAKLQAADLSRADLQGADLRRSNLRRARLAYANLRDCNLEGANWGNYVLGEEIDWDFGHAASAYRALKQWHTEAGIYDVAGEFHYREMEARRKLTLEELRLPYALAMYLLRSLYGYGERPERVIAWAAAVVFGFALGHWLFGTVAGGFLDALYYSAVSFTALGYGASASFPQGWAGRFLGPAESLMGVFMMALFLVTFTRKMTR